VNWIKKGSWEEEKHDIVVKTLTDITKYPEYVSRLKANIGIDETGTTDSVVKEEAAIYIPSAFEPYSVEQATADLFIEKDRFMQMLNRFRAKKNLILQGAPGVGKTFFARKLAYALIGERNVTRVK